MTWTRAVTCCSLRWRTVRCQPQSVPGSGNATKHSDDSLRRTKYTTASAAAAANGLHKPEWKPVVTTQCSFHCLTSLCHRQAHLCATQATSVKTQCGTGHPPNTFLHKSHALASARAVRLRQASHAPARSRSSTIRNSSACSEIDSRLRVLCLGALASCFATACFKVSSSVFATWYS